MLDLYEQYEKLETEDIVLAYKGNVTGDLFNVILQLAETKLEKMEEQARVKKKVFNVLVEILQNIFHHFDDIKSESEEFYSVLFLLLKVKDQYQIITGNHILAHRVAELKSRIDEINDLNEEELKQVYREKLNDGNMSDKGGAGLGILDIARKSNQKLEYEFRKVNSKFSFFVLKVNIRI